MRRLLPFVSSLIAAPALLLGGCENIVDLRGFAPTPGAVEKLEVGTQSRDDVIRLIGTPSAVSTFNPNIWYFISQRQETFAFLKPEITKQDVIQVTFSDAGRITDIKSYDINNARSIEMVARVTPTAGKELTVLEQIMGNIGRFSGPKRETNPGADTGGN